MNSFLSIDMGSNPWRGGRGSQKVEEEGQKK